MSIGGAYGKKSPTEAGLCFSLQITIKRQKKGRTQ
jgi:hypothetical protein